MRFVFIYFLLFTYTFTFAQNTTHQSKVDALKAKIKSEKNNGEKLNLIDILTNITKIKTAL
jgi:hypothetical protein